MDITTYVQACVVYMHGTNDIHAYLPVYLSHYLTASLPDLPDLTLLTTYLYLPLPASACLPASMQRCIQPSIHTSMNPYIHTYIHTCIHASYASMHPYVHTCIQHTHIPYCRCHRELGRSNNFVRVIRSLFNSSWFTCVSRPWSFEFLHACIS